MPPNPAENCRKPPFAIVGCGRVGRALARRLAAAGYPVAGLASRRLESARQAAAEIGAERYTDRSETVTRLAELVFITTPDDCIQAVCQALVQLQGVRPEAVVLHCSGALPSGILAAAAATGAAIGSLHPMQSFTAEPTHVNPFAGVAISAEGDARALDAARQIAFDLGGQFHRIRTEGKLLYHAGAVVASNYLVALLDMSLTLLAAAGMAPAEALATLEPLIQGTLRNLQRVGPVLALTGPVARGDGATVAAHLEAIRKQVPALEELYRSLGRHTLELAKQAGLAPQRAAIMQRLLTTGNPVEDAPPDGRGAAA